MMYLHMKWGGRPRDELCQPFCKGTKLYSPGFPPPYVTSRPYLLMLSCYLRLKMDFREYGNIHVLAPRKVRKAGRGKRGREGRRWEGSLTIGQSEEVLKPPKVVLLWQCCPAAAKSEAPLGSLAWAAWPDTCGPLERCA